MNSFIEKKLGKFYHPIIWGIKRNWKYKHIYSGYYKKLIKKTIVDPKKIIIFTPNFDSMSPSVNLIYEQLCEKGYAISIINQFKDEKDVFNFISCIVSSVIIITSNDDPILNVLPIRKETKIVNLWHGCGALKKFGYSKMKEWNKSVFSFKKYQNVSLFTVSSEKVLPFYSEATGISLTRNIIKATGISRTDIFFDKKYLEACYEKKLKLTDKKIILYAPTFRGHNLSTAFTPEFLDFEFLKEQLGSEYIFLVKRHPDTLGKHYSIPDSCKDFVFDVSSDGSISDLIVMSDILISDYSSLFFEWCLFDKPVLFLTPDFEDYFDNRGFYIKFELFVEKARCNNSQELVSAIQNINNYDFSFLKQVRDDYMSACDGHATKRIIELI